jgi:biopolymer transport protein ExbD
MKKRTRTNPEINTASLPDIIFMLLFFFMVVTVLRKESSKLFHDLPETAYSQKIETSKNAAYVYIGRKSIKGKELSVQINDQLVNQLGLDAAFTKLIKDPKIDVSTFEVTLKADRFTNMKLVRKVKLAMRKAGIRHLFYLTELET